MSSLLQKAAFVLGLIDWTQSHSQ